MSTETSWEAWVAILAQQYNYSIVLWHDIFYVFLIAELQYALKLVVCKNWCQFYYRMSFTGLQKHWLFLLFIQRPDWCLLYKNINKFNVFNVIVVLKVTALFYGWKLKYRRDNWLGQGSHRKPVAVYGPELSLAKL